jgi:hypothetical protein
MTKLKIEVEVDSKHLDDWTKFVTCFDDIFASTYIGYWAYGMKRTDGLGWLVYEHAGEGTSVRGAAGLPEYPEVVRLWKQKRKLPPKWYRLDADAAKRAFVEGVKAWGADWYKDGNTDATRYDYVLQMVLLGEERYG